MKTKLEGRAYKGLYVRNGMIWMSVTWEGQRHRISAETRDWEKAVATWVRPN